MKTSVIVLLAAGDMSGSISSNPFRVENMDLAALQAVWTGAAPTGTFKLQASCDAGTDAQTGPSGFGVTNWTDVASSSNAITASGDFMWNLTDMGYRWVRVVYTRTSGTGTLLITANAKSRA